MLQDEHGTQYTRLCLDYLFSKMSSKILNEIHLESAVESKLYRNGFVFVYHLQKLVHIIFQTIEMPYVRREQCQEFMVERNHPLTPNMFCAGRQVHVYTLLML